MAERLNKPWLETVVYDLRDSMRGITDLKLTVLRRAWRRNQHVGQLAKSRGLSTIPLLLVQVANGDAAIREAYDFLTKELAIAPNAVAMHSAEEPDPVMMAAIAVNTAIGADFQTGLQAPALMRRAPLCWHRPNQSTMKTLPCSSLAG
ncbi:MAG: hypothetical protein IPN53_20945 [Comamonadaceae bacterium]|nr:hypothetical protein [Comamonadaceae bacterium]